MGNDEFGSHLLGQGTLRLVIRIVFYIYDKTNYFDAHGLIL